MTNLLTFTHFETRAVLVTALLIAAAVIDVREHRIPNVLILAGLCIAIPYNGLHSAPADINGWVMASAPCDGCR